MDYQLWQGDCLEEMSRIEDGSVDAIIADLPYGTTACKWDIVIPFEPLWKQYKRVIKKRGAIVLFGSEPFSSLLRLSNLDWYKYDWVWDKQRSSSGLDAKIRPLNAHENIMIFFSKGAIYNPQMEEMTPAEIKKYPKLDSCAIGTITRGGHKRVMKGYYQGMKKYPRSLIRIKGIPARSDEKQKGLRITQKPVALLSYLIKTYTNEGETVLDNTCGSGSTLESAMRCNRRSIGIEKDAHYFNVATQRLARVAAELRGELNHLPMFAEVAA